MADTAERDREWEAWLAEPERTDKVREIARRLPPWGVYRLKPTGQRAQIEAYSEDGTVRATCWYDYHPGMVLLAVEVFGLDPNDFEAAN